MGDYSKVFQLRIKSIRTELGLTQGEVSKDTGIDQSRISKYESGELQPDLDKLGILANYYQISIDWLLGNPHSTKRGEE